MYIILKRNNFNDIHIIMTWNEQNLELGYYFITLTRSSVQITNWGTATTAGGTGWLAATCSYTVTQHVTCNCVVSCACM